MTHFSFYHCDHPMRQACESPFTSRVAVPSCSHSSHTPYCLGGRTLSILGISFLLRLPTPGIWPLGTLVLLKFCPLAPHAAPRPTLCPCCPALLEIHFQAQGSVISFPTRIVSRVFKSACPLEPRLKVPGLREALLLMFRCVPYSRRCCRNLLTHMSLILALARLRFLFTRLFVRGGF